MLLPSETEQRCCHLDHWTASVAQGCLLMALCLPGQVQGEVCNGQDLGPDLHLPAREAEKVIFGHSGFQGGLWAPLDTRGDLSHTQEVRSESGWLKRMAKVDVGASNNGTQAGGTCKRQRAELILQIFYYLIFTTTL